MNRNDDHLGRIKPAIIGGAAGLVLGLSYVFMHSTLGWRSGLGQHYETGFPEAAQEAETYRGQPAPPPIP